jgi:hypothetical protein
MPCWRGDKGVRGDAQARPALLVYRCVDDLHNRRRAIYTKNSSWVMYMRLAEA